ncbi:MAG: hypothetical protein KKG75_04875 [Nanoarchaeota archaeon]|nr:hypothetical protein [Nanoarchaeota archaeon]
MKKYLLLIEDEKLWDSFKSKINRDLNTEIIELIRKKVEAFKKASAKQK